MYLKHHVLRFNSIYFLIIVKTLKKFKASFFEHVIEGKHREIFMLFNTFKI